MLNVHGPRRAFRLRAPTRAGLPSTTVVALPRTSVATRSRAPCHHRRRESAHRSVVPLRAEVHARGEAVPLGEDSPNGAGARLAECVLAPPPFLLHPRWRREAGPNELERHGQLDVDTLSHCGPRPISAPPWRHGPARPPYAAGPASLSACSCVQSGCFIVGGDEGRAQPGRGVPPCISDTMSHSAWARPWLVPARLPVLEAHERAREQRTAARARRRRFTDGHRRRRAHRPVAATCASA